MVPCYIHLVICVVKKLKSESNGPHFVYAVLKSILSEDIGKDKPFTAPVLIKMYDTTNLRCKKH